MIRVTALSRSRAVATRAFSTPPGKIQLTPEEIQKGIERTDKYRKFLQKSAGPKLTQGLGSGKDLHVPANVAELAVLNGMPSEHASRTVLIGQRMLKSVQSGSATAHQWQITWKNQERWSNPLMGWTSSADPMSSMKLNFDSKEEAMGFAERNGWAYQLLRETSKSNRPAGFTHYKHNFLDKRTLGFLKKDGLKTKIFDAPGWGSSNFFMPLTYHGDGEVDQHGPAVQKAK